MMPFLLFIAAFAADAYFGDPLGNFHIVVAIGRLIALLEKIIRRLLPKKPAAEMAGGIVLVLLVAVIPAGGVFLALYFLTKLSPWAAFGVELFVCWQCLSMRSLSQESMKVCKLACTGDLARARGAMSLIVGRDTESLDLSGVTRACVETVAENTSDGVIAPLLFMAAGGAPLAVLYKAVNTMDSMLGYKNEKYLFFGRAAARLDDVFNFIPARISALFMIAGAYFLGYDAANARRVFLRDRLKHSSPNAGQTESVCAGALHVRLGGPSCYGGKRVVKPTIGDDLRPIEPWDIRRACRLMTVCSVLVFFVLAVIKGAAGILF